MMVGVALKTIEINSNYRYLSLVVFAVICFLFLIYFISLSAKINRATKEQREEGLKILREFTDHGSVITSWLKEHREELQKLPIVTLNSQEFVDLINQDHELYERILEIYPDYPDTIMPPKELRQYLIELAQGQHKQTH